MPGEKARFLRIYMTSIMGEAFSCELRGIRKGGGGIKLIGICR